MVLHAQLVSINGKPDEEPGGNAETSRESIREANLTRAVAWSAPVDELTSDILVGEPFTSSSLSISCLTPIEILSSTREASELKSANNLHRSLNDGIRVGRTEVRKFTFLCIKSRVHEDDVLDVTS